MSAAPPTTNPVDILVDVAPQLDRERRRVATWHRTRVGGEDRVRVTVTRWGRRDVIGQTGVTVDSLKDAWHVVAATGCVDQRRVASTDTFIAWCVLAKRG